MMSANRKAPDAVAAAPGAGSVSFRGVTLPHTATDLNSASRLARAWLTARHHVRPEWVGVIVEAARLGGGA